MDRKNPSKLQNIPMNNGDGNQANFMRYNKKGSYNFGRNYANPPVNLKAEPNEPERTADNPKPQTAAEIVRGDVEINFAAKLTEKKIDNTANETTYETVRGNDNVKRVEHVKDIDTEWKAENTEKKKNDKMQGQNQNKHFVNKKKTKSEAAAINKEPIEVDADGFMKVKYRGPKKQKNADHQNENVPWIMPGRDNKV